MSHQNEDLIALHHEIRAARRAWEDDFNRAQRPVHTATTAVDFARESAAFDGAAVNARHAPGMAALRARIPQGPGFAWIGCDVAFD